MTMRSTPKRLLGILALAALAGAAGCSRSKVVQSAAPAPVPVQATAAVRKDLPVEVRAIGSGEAYSSVSLKPQISGPITGVFFKEGDFVRKGQLLFTIDPKPFQAALDQALGNLARDKAVAENAAVEAERYKKLWDEKVVAKEQSDQYQAAADSARAAVQADEAAVEYARVQLSYCKIYAPNSGRTGSLLVHVGDAVKANDVPNLLVINQINPIYVDFSVPERYLTEIKRQMAERRLPVQVYLPNEAAHPEQGYLSFVDNTVDPSTGTIKLKGAFANSNRRLWPGQFSNVALTLGEQKNAIVVPSRAVETGQEGQYVFVVRPNHTVESRPVVVGNSLGTESVIEKGLQPGELVVTDGQIRLVPDAKVVLKNGL
jgi:membrane fusion protein, multidrug efflux system